MPRRRSNSLPIQKIQVSVFQSINNTNKRRSSLLLENDSNHTSWRKPSEKKRRIKMADSRAFVELKPLSKSEKALEKIEQQNKPQVLIQQVSK